MNCLHQLICKRGTSAFINFLLFCSVIELQPGLQSGSSFSAFQCGELILKLLGQSGSCILQTSELNKGVERMCMYVHVCTSTHSHTHIHIANFFPGSFYSSYEDRPQINSYPGFLVNSIFTRSKIFSSLHDAYIFTFHLLLRTVISWKVGNKTFISLSQYQPSSGLSHMFNNSGLSADWVVDCYFFFFELKTRCDFLWNLKQTQSSYFITAPVPHFSGVSLNYFNTRNSQRIDA